MQTSCECGKLVDSNLPSEFMACKSCFDMEILRLIEYKKSRSCYFPQIDLIIDGIYLGNEYTSKNKALLESNKITHILICGSTLEAHFPENYKYELLPIDDFQFHDIKQHFAKAYEFIENAKKGGGIVFVHCAQGISRSATIVISYLMKLKGWSFQEALDFVKKQRCCVGPNPGFKTQLADYEKSLENLGKSESKEIN
jgi:protein-tyrosine phosphatase